MWTLCYPRNHWMDTGHSSTPPKLQRTSAAAAAPPPRAAATHWQLSANDCIFSLLIDYTFPLILSRGPIIQNYKLKKFIF
mmetsp:Transcript_13247/g.25204  ORF Transcript_13247/g.25204 Transcript_13247/m.25204 type:complete len:80 (+) Transcript_13247:1041-1280(+)